MAFNIHPIKTTISKSGKVCHDMKDQIVDRTVTLTRDDIQNLINNIRLYFEVGDEEAIITIKYWAENLDVVRPHKGPLGEDY